MTRILTDEQKERKRLYNIEYRKANREKYRDYNKAWVKRSGHKSTEQTRNRRASLTKAQQMFERSRDRAKHQDIAFDITPEDIVIPEFCPYLGIPIVTGVGKMTDNSPSLDRIDSAKGYIKGNVEVISFRANTIKNCGTPQEHMMIGIRQLKLLNQQTPPQSH
jgi:hypothetical protein